MPTIEIAHCASNPHQEPPSQQALALRRMRDHWGYAGLCIPTLLCTDRAQGVKLPALRLAQKEKETKTLTARAWAGLLRGPGGAARGSLTGSDRSQARPGSHRLWGVGHVAFQRALRGRPRRSHPGRLAVLGHAAARQRAHEEVEGHLRGIDAVLIDEAGRHPCTHHGANVIGRHALKQVVQAQAAQHQRRHRPLQDAARERVLLDVRHRRLVHLLDAIAHPVDLDGQTTSRLNLRDVVLAVGLPDGLELALGVVDDNFQDLLHVGAVELGGLVALIGVVAHVLRVILHRQRQGGEDLQRRAGDAALVRGGVLEDVHPGLLQDLAGAVGEEEVGALHDHPELRLAVLAEELLDVVGVDGVGPAPTWHEQVGRRVGQEMEHIPQLRARTPRRAVGQRHVYLVDCHKEAIGTQEGPRKVIDRQAGLCQPHELGAAEPIGIVSHARAVHDSDGLVLGDEDLVGTQVAVGPACLELRDGRLVLAQRLQELGHVGVDAGRGHAVRVVRHAAQLDALPRRDGLPIGVAPAPGKLRAKVHEVRCVLVGAEVQELGLALHVAAVDTALCRQHAVQQGVQVAREARPLRRRILRVAAWHRSAMLEVWQNDALGAALGNVLVLHLLREGQVVGLVEQRGVAPLVRRPVAREDEADAAARHVAEAHMEA
mmetsp:Transcript_69787/g.179972  ORF Transcript_69787/g.179972 Transcript_69787/m.179972 type:complete len:658 (-) Transcript_69787:1856-3829(-)